MSNNEERITNKVSKDGFVWAVLLMNGVLMRLKNTVSRINGFITSHVSRLMPHVAWVRANYAQKTHERVSGGAAERYHSHSLPLCLFAFASLRLIIALPLCLSASLPLFAASAPKIIHWQGNLRDAGGVPLSGSNFNFTFQIFNDPTAGSQLWSESYVNQTVANGLYEFDLGSGQTIPDSVFENEPIYLQIQVSAGADPLETLTPRIRLVGAPYAVHALWSDRLRADAEAYVKAGAIVSTFTTAGHLLLPGGLGLAGNVAVSSGQIVFGGGANQSLSAAQAAELTGGAVTSIHSHTGIDPAPHAFKHALSGFDSLASYFIANQNTLQAGATFYITSGTTIGTLRALGGFIGSGANITNINAVNITAGTLDDNRFSGAVTLQGNQFNGANYLLKLDGSGNLPSLNASNLHTLNASQLLSGTVPNQRLDGSSVTLVGPIVELNTSEVSGILPETNGGTGESSYTQGDLLYADAANSLAKLTVSGSSGKFLKSNGAVPSWQAITNADVAGVINNQDTLQAGATFYVSSGSVEGTLISYGGFVGSGASLTDLNAGNLSAGTVPSARISGTYANALAFTGGVTLTANNLMLGPGASLTAAGQEGITISTDA
ncbi:MAG: hypothetical protein HY747_03795, partial [Elusimicrobia bacterium]|nr:hypothetical protein [Elusimicrobiota bacterium]